MFEDDELESGMGQREDLGEMDVEDLEGNEVGKEGKKREESSEAAMVALDDNWVLEVRALVLVGPISTNLVREVVREESEERDRLSLDVEEGLKVGRDQLASADAD